MPPRQSTGHRDPRPPMLPLPLARKPLTRMKQEPATARRTPSASDSKVAAVLLMDLFRRKAMSAPYQNKPKNKMGEFGKKNLALLSWRQYCVHKFSL